MAKPNRVAEEFDSILNDITNGKSLYKACKERKISSQSFYNEMEKDDSLKEKYARARDDRGDAYIDRIEEIMKQIQNKEIDAQAGRVLIDTMKWAAGKFNGSYGDSQKITHAGSIVVMPTVKVNGKDFKMDIGEDVD